MNKYTLSTLFISLLLSASFSFAYPKLVLLTENPEEEFTLYENENEEKGHLVKAKELKNAQVVNSNGQGGYIEIIFGPKNERRWIHESLVKNNSSIVLKSTVRDQTEETGISSGLGGGATNVRK